MLFANDVLQGSSQQVLEVAQPVLNIFQKPTELQYTCIAMSSFCFTSKNIVVCLQGRFWQEQFQALNVPEASRSKFEFEDGNPRVCSDIPWTSLDVFISCRI